MKAITDRLTRETAALDFTGTKAAFVYNPLEYARKPYDLYLERYGAAPKKAVFLGMNPGPFGMAQTGIPFGEVSLVRDWLGICADVSRPPREHPKRPVSGFDCRKSEVSGRRLWMWAKNRFGSPEIFFRDVFVLNYCPLVFMEESGRNLTPDKLPAPVREELTRICDRALRDSIAFFKPRFCVGIGAYAKERFDEILHGTGAQTMLLTHPSPANPKANAGWEKFADALADEIGLR
ncbi:MAG: uracil-DNA glycosylase family protein [Elusimicrobiaceae bacterium]